MCVYIYIHICLHIVKVSFKIWYQALQYQMLDAENDKKEAVYHNR